LLVTSSYRNLSRGCYRLRHCACHSAYLIGRPAFCCSVYIVVLPVCPCVVSFSRFHGPDTHDLSRGCNGDPREGATRKMLPWNFSLSPRTIFTVYVGTSLRLRGSCDAEDASINYTQYATVQYINFLRRNVDRIVTPPLQGAARSIVMGMSVCLSVRSHNSKTTRPNLSRFVAHVAYMAVVRSSSDGVAIRYV